MNSIPLEYIPVTSNRRRKRTVIKTRTAATPLRPEEYNALRELSHKNGVSISAYLRSIIIDALVEEGFDARRFRQEGNSPSREGSEATGDSTQ